MISNIIKKIIYSITAPNYQKQSDDIIELKWANIYHDTIRSIPWLVKLSISPYDMSINYSMLYVLTRIVNDYEIKNILEFGLGQSSIFINAFVEQRETSTIHHIIEHDMEWIKFFRSKISNKSEIIQLNLKKENTSENTVQVYDNLLTNIKRPYDLYIVDGPKGLPHFSRFDICHIAMNFHKDDQFIIIMDDYHREGEKETIEKLKSILNDKSIPFKSKIYKGIKHQFLLVTEKYKFATTF